VSFQAGLSVVLTTGIALVPESLYAVENSMSSSKIDFNLLIGTSLLAISLVSSLIYIVLEGYTIFRLWFLLFPRVVQLRTLTDFRLRRAIALLLFELLTIVPAAVETNIIGDFLPFSTGTLIVLCQFFFD
jgi:hypothetical protein